MSFEALENLGQIPTQNRRVSKSQIQKKGDLRYNPLPQEQETSIFDLNKTHHTLGNLIQKLRHHTGFAGDFYKTDTQEIQKKE